MGLILQFRCSPTPLDVADDSLAAFMNVDMLYRDLLLALATVPIESLDQR